MAWPGMTLNTFLLCAQRFFQGSTSPRVYAGRLNLCVPPALLRRDRARASTLGRTPGLNMSGKFVFSLEYTRRTSCRVSHECVWSKGEGVDRARYIRKRMRLDAREKNFRWERTQNTYRLVEVLGFLLLDNGFFHEGQLEKLLSRGLANLVPGEICCRQPSAQPFHSGTPRMVAADSR